MVGRWVGSRRSDQGQLAYYREGTTRRERAYRITACSARSRCRSVVSTYPTRWNQLLLAMGLPPLLAGIREAYSYKKADKELIKQFRFMSRLYRPLEAQGLSA